MEPTDVFPDCPLSPRRYNLGMRFRTTLPTVCRSLGLLLILMMPSCTFYGDHPARTAEEATGGEGLERVFWKNVAARNWIEIDHALASNYTGVTGAGNLDRAAALDQYRQWQLKDYSIGDLKTELNGTTVVVTYTITLNGTAAAQPLPSTPQRMMSVWQQEKLGWVVIAHSASQ